MNVLEKEFLQSIKEVDQLTPKDVFFIENETLPPDCVQYCINLNDKQFHIIIMKNGNEVLMLAKEDGSVLKNLKNGELAYQELKRKARVWYKGIDLNQYKVVFNNQECKVILDVFSFIQPFVLKSVNDSSLKYIGLDFLTIFSLISKHEEKEIEEGVNELYYDENINYASYEVIKSLFPNALEIYLKYDPIEDHHFFEVDRKFGAWQENVDYLLSYQYFTGASYNDIVDLTRKACEDRTLHKDDAHWFLP